jgi:hypothetical protein
MLTITANLKVNRLTKSTSHLFVMSIEQQWRHESAQRRENRGLDPSVPGFPVLIYMEQFLYCKQGMNSNTVKLIFSLKPSS